MGIASDSAAALGVAVRANDAARVAQVLERHPELKSKLDEAMPQGAFGATPLLSAVHQANREMIDVLLRAGADINARSHWWAGSFGVLDHDGDLAAYLIERGATVDVHAAARLGMVDRLESLIAADPRLVHARGGDGQTPLHFASTVEIARLLLDRGAILDARDIDHESTPAQWMVRDRQDVARELVSLGCRTDVLMASALGDVDLVRRHLDDDPACVATTVSDRWFPKQNPHSGGTVYNWTLGGNKTGHAVAREFRHEDVFDLLIGRSPAELRLAVACEMGDSGAVAALGASQPNLAAHLPDDARRRIADAAEGNRTETVRLMLAAGWPVSARGRHGATTLHWAAWHGNAEMLREILRCAPPLEAADEAYGGTPLGWAIHGSTNSWHCRTGDYGAVVDALLQAGAQAPIEDGQASDAVREALRRHAASRT